MGTRGRVWHFATILVGCCLTVAMALLVNPSARGDDDVVTYEVVSDSVVVANIQYQDSAGRVVVGAAKLPWRLEAVVRSALGPPPDGSQVRADWRSAAAPTRWVTVRIIHQGRIVCQTTLDIGNAACYGVTPRIT